jgi:CRP-like cAMP-binding protein
MHKYDLIMSPHPFFSGMCDHHIKLLAESMHPTRFRKDTYVFREGELANRFYLIQHGRIALESSDGGEVKIDVQTLSDGDMLGWSWLFPPHNWRFDAHAIEDTDALAVIGVRLRELCETDKTLGYEVMKRVAEVLVHRLQITRLKLISATYASAAVATAGATLRM